MPVKVPEWAHRHGLTSVRALKRLADGIKEELNRQREDEEAEAATKSWAAAVARRYSLREALHPTAAMSVFPLTSMLAAAAIAVALLVRGVGGADLAYSISAALLVLALAALSVLVQVREAGLSRSETRRRLAHVAERVGRVHDVFRAANADLAGGDPATNAAGAAGWAPLHYPHLHTPVTASVVLQWTVRDGHQVNLPWALLVRDDLVIIKPGQGAPGLCHSLRRPDVVLHPDEVLNVRTSKDEAGGPPTPEFKTPAAPQFFVMDETPYLRLARKALARDRTATRPPPLLWRYARLLFVRTLVHGLLPAFAGVALVWNAVRLIDPRWSIYNGDAAAASSALAWDWLLLEPALVALPLIPLVFPLLWTLVNYGCLAHVLAVFTSFRHVTVSADPFDDVIDEPGVAAAAAAGSAALWKKPHRSLLLSALRGTGEYVAHSENLFQTLGSVTVLCCTDKKGILSWPNASPEKVFIVKKEKPATSGDDTAKVEKLVPEVLTLTHDRRNPFNVDFDDPSWRTYLQYLKPLGLGILLNTCNLSTEEKYTGFFNHLMCESLRAEASAEHRKGGETTGVAGGGGGSSSERRGKDREGVIEMLPIVTRGCLCELAHKIGFSDGVAAQYALASQIQTFRKVEPNHRDKFASNLSKARLKFPFPHLVSVAVQHRTTGSRQLISQGTADVVLDSCTDCWTGGDLDELNVEIRKKVLDFYQRASLSSYCTAFAFRPLTFQLPWRNCREYLQLPTHSNPFYWHYAEEARCLDADVITSHISMGSKTDASHEEDKLRGSEDYVKTKDDALMCLELECNQTFLGMIQLQYQAVVDFVQLIDLLEKACIRFVHFSKENELRSRVFSEKMGLESGWNCHISLKSNSYPSTKTVDYGEERLDKRKLSPNNPMLKAKLKKTKVGISLPDHLDRPAWYLDFPKWQENKNMWANGDNTSPKDDQSSLLQNGTENQGSLGSGDSEDPFDYDMSNRAQLPRGIENIRPHLETMDNVPLLVSLFTDCTPENSAEMLKIMQEYREVVCVIGSSANHRNIDSFLQADASMAIEPRYPQLCQKVPVSLPTPAGVPSPAEVSQMLISVASSLSFNMTDGVSCFHLIMESRHLTLALINALKFWTSAAVFVAALQLISLLLTLPPALGLGHTLTIVCLTLPALALSLLGTRLDLSVMSISTGKNVIPLNGDVYRFAAWCYGSRFFPSIVVLAAGHLLSVLAFQNDLTSKTDCVVNADTDDLPSECASLRPHVDSYSVQCLNFAFVHLYLVVISASFVARGHQLWQRLPFTRCPSWAIVAAVTLILAAGWGAASGWLPPAQCWIVWLTGLPLVMVINELVKRQEIKVDVRHQKRERLEFGTKLGMVSPF